MSGICVVFVLQAEGGIRVAQGFRGVDKCKRDGVNSLELCRNSVRCALRGAARERGELIKKAAKINFSGFFIIVGLYLISVSHTHLTLPTYRIVSLSGAALSFNKNIPSHRSTSIALH